MMSLVCSKIRRKSHHRQLEVRNTYHVILPVGTEISYYLEYDPQIHINTSKVPGNPSPKIYQIISVYHLHWTPPLWNAYTVKSLFHAHSLLQSHPIFILKSYPSPKSILNFPQTATATGQNSPVPSTTNACNLFLAFPHSIHSDSSTKESGSRMRVSIVGWGLRGRWILLLGKLDI